MTAPVILTGRAGQRIRKRLDDLTDLARLAQQPPEPPELQPQPGATTIAEGPAPRLNRQAEE